MKKLALALLMGFLMIPSAFSFTIIKDPKVFYSFFENPKKIFSFIQLKDGTSYDSIPNRFKSNSFNASETDCLISDTGDDNSLDGFKALAVRPNAFSNAWSFMGADPKKPDSFCEAVIWFDQGISTGIYKMTVVATAGESQPFVMYTNKGFIGILPDSPQETLFIFDNPYFVFSFETEFSKPAAVSESDDKFWAQFEIN